MSRGPTGTIHLVRAVPQPRGDGRDHAEALGDSPLGEAGPSDQPSWQGLSWHERALCGRRWSVIGLPDGIDPLGAQRHRLCQSCWVIVEGWLSPPPPAAGEDSVAAWLLTTVLRVGEALVEEVPVPRMEALRRRIRAEVKAAVGGSVSTRAISPSTLWVSSGLVNGAKTPERWAADIQAGLERLQSFQDGEDVPPASWRGRWSEIAQHP